MERDLNDVLVFAKVVELGSFTAAAREFQVPTSSVSRRVARLEDHLGAQLLSRSTRRLHLTDVGRTFFEYSSRIASDLVEAERLVSDLQQSPRGRLRVTVPAGAGLLTAEIFAFVREYPEVSVEIDMSDRRVDLIEEGFDVALRAGTLPDSSLIAHRLHDSPLRLYASPAYLERRGTPQNTTELSQHDCVVFPSLLDKGAWILQVGGVTTRVPVSGRVVVNRLSAARQAAMMGLGITLLPVHGVDTESEPGRLAPVLPEASPPGGALWIVYPSRRNLSPKVRAFVEFMKERTWARLASACNGNPHRCDKGDPALVHDEFETQHVAAETSAGRTDGASKTRPRSKKRSSTTRSKR